MAENLLHPPRPGLRLDLVDAGRSPDGTPVQLGLDELGTPLHEATFVVVDLETTGGSPASSEITEIGAVKVRGGEVIGEFQTLVNPGLAIPPMITVLTGITNAMVIAAPPITAVLPAFLEFAHGAVLVAHNARFDVGFLRAAADRMDLAWPRPQVVDTVALARRVVTKDEAPNHKLGTLAALFGASTTPDHRALSDARATVDVLHALFGRMTALGVTHLEDLATAADPVPHARRRKATLADYLPTGPGVYQFLGPRGEVLYVGTALNLRRRVRTYFTAAEKRARIGEMVDLATQVRPIPCATALEAQVRELRMIAELKPPYNRRSRAPERQPWVRLTDEAHPRLSVVREVPVDRRDRAIGPFPSRMAALLAIEAIQQAVPLRQCSPRLPLVPRASATACVLAEIGRCVAPCVSGENGASYPDLVTEAGAVLAGDAQPVITAAHRAIAHLSAQLRFEEAGGHRDRLAAFLRAAARTQRLAPLQQAEEIVAAQPREGGWEIVLVRYGRFAGTAVSPHGANPLTVVESLRAGGESVAEPERLGGGASAEESELLATWLETPGTRLIQFESADTSVGWSWPVGGAGRYLRTLGVGEVDPRVLESRVLGPRTGSGTENEEPAGAPLAKREVPPALRHGPGTA